jgi:D-xylose transport system substrate-binding protein
MRRTVRIASALVAAALALAAAGCSGGKPSHGAGAAASAGASGGVVGGAGPGTSSAKKLTIAFLTPCSTTCANRFDEQDVPQFTQAVHEIDRGITIAAHNAQGRGANQISQAQAALAAGANVIVVDPVDKAAGTAVAAKAKAAGVPVVAYDTLLSGARPDYYVGFDNQKAGELQGQYLANRLPAGATVAILNAEQGTDQGRAFKAGAHKVLDPLFASGKLRRGYEGDARTATVATGRTLTQQALGRTGTKLAGLLAATDTLAEGAVTALSAANLSGKVAVTGGGASDAGLRRVLQNTQAMTVYNAVKQEARAAAKIAVLAGRGNAAAAKSTTKTTVDGGSGKVPALLLTPIVVTSYNMGQTVLADGFTTRQKLCTTAVKDKCPA